MARINNGSTHTTPRTAPHTAAQTANRSRTLSKELKQGLSALEHGSQAGKVAAALLQGLSQSAPELAAEIGTLIGVKQRALPGSDMSPGHNPLAFMSQMPPGAGGAAGIQKALASIGLMPPPAENYFSGKELKTNLDETFGVGTDDANDLAAATFQMGEGALAMAMGGASESAMAGFLGGDNPHSKKMAGLIKNVAAQLSKSPPDEAAASKAIMEAHHGFIEFAADGNPDMRAKLQQLFKAEYGIDEPGQQVFNGQGPFGAAANAAGVGNNPAPPHGTRTVNKGDSLWKIAQEQYGDGRKWPLIAAANGLPTTGNPVIHPGQELKVPGASTMSSSGGLTSSGTAGADVVYGPNGGPGPGGLGALRAAQGQVGVSEASGNNDGVPSQRYMNGRKEPWCANFVAWSFEQSGSPLPGNRRSLASVQYMEDQMKGAGKWFPRGQQAPQPGDVIFFGNRGGSDAGPGRHVGIVERVENGRVYTVEGNSGNAVKRRSYALDNARITGYGRQDSAPPQAAGAPPGVSGQSGVTPQALRSIVPQLSEARAQQLTPHLNRAMAEAGIDTKNEKAAFIAQLAHESAGFVHFEEIASGSAYEGRRDLGNTQPGDGRRFKGRGPIQLTGRANYEQASRDLGVDLVNNPEQAANVDTGFRVAAWYWNSRNINEPANRGDFLTVTRRINGGTNGLADRQRYYERALSQL